MLYYMMPCPILSETYSLETTLLFIVLRDATVCYTMLCHIDTMLQYTTACYIIRNYTMLYYTTLAMLYSATHYSTDTNALLYNEICYILHYGIQYYVIAHDSLA